MTEQSTGLVHGVGPELITLLEVASVGREVTRQRERNANRNRLALGNRAARRSARRGHHRQRRERDRSYTQRAKISSFSIHSFPQRCTSPALPRCSSPDPITR